MKIKIFRGYLTSTYQPAEATDKLEERVNEFIKNKKVISIQTENIEEIREKDRETTTVRVMTMLMIVQYEEVEPNENNS